MDQCLKYKGYTSGALDAKLEVMKHGTLQKKHLNKVKSFHHGAMKHILHIKWHQMREKHIKIVSKMN